MKVERSRLMAVEMVSAVNGDATLPGVFRLRLQLEDLESETGWIERDFVCVDDERKEAILAEMKAAEMHWEGEPPASDRHPLHIQDLRDVVAADLDAENAKDEGEVKVDPEVRPRLRVTSIDPLPHAEEDVTIGVDRRVHLLPSKAVQISGHFDRLDHSGWDYGDIDPCHVDWPVGAREALGRITRFTVTYIDASEGTWEATVEPEDLG